MTERVVRVIDVRKQESLSIGKCLHLVLSGIAHRLLRSTLTTAVILLAVAFFTAMLTENMFLHAVNDGVKEMITERRAAVKRLGFMYSLPTEQEMTVYLSTVVDDPAAIAENAAVAGLTVEQVARIAGLCRQERAYEDFFNNLDIGKRRALISKRQGRDIYLHLTDEKEFNDFLAKLQPMSSLQLPTVSGRSDSSIAEMREFVSGYPDFLNDMKTYTNLWRKKITEFRRETNQLTGDNPVQKWLSTASGAAVEKWRQLAVKAGFQLNADELHAMRGRFTHLSLREAVVGDLSTSEARDQWKKVFNVEKASLAEKLEKINNEQVMKEILKGKYSREQLDAVASQYLEEKRLNELEADLNGKLEKSSGSILSGRQLFLLVISFLVCMVGIANAMLMAITERFREIATMKCLGATDGYILLQFMLEAALQGLAGGSVGMLVGFLLALAKNSYYYGGYLFEFFPLGGTILCSAVSLFAGIILSSMASLYPSWAASRMAPMEAMRVE